MAAAAISSEQTVLGSLTLKTVQAKRRKTALLLVFLKNIKFKENKTKQNKK